MKYLIINLFKQVLAGVISAISMVILWYYAQPFAIILIWLFVFPLFTSILSGIIRGVIHKDWETLIFAFKIFGGNFITGDDNRFFAGVFIIVRHIVWEQPQTLLGNFGMHVLNSVWLLKKIDVWKHTLVCQGLFLNGGGIAFGSFIMIDLQGAPPVDLTNMDERKVPEKVLIRHEYGHSLQSIISGPLFIFKYGIPSILMQGWTEDDADWRSDRKLLKEDQIMPIFSVRYKNKQPVLPKWWEYTVTPLLPGAGWFINEVNGLAGGILFSIVLITVINLKKPA